MFQSLFSRTAIEMWVSVVGSQLEGVGLISYGPLQVTQHQSHISSIAKRRRITGSDFQHLIPNGQRALWITSTAEQQSAIKQPRKRICISSCNCS